MRSSTKSRGGLLWAAVALTALVALPATSHAAPPQVAAVNVSPSGLSWAPQVDYAKLVLTVSGGGYTQTFEFEGAPHFAPVDAEGYQLPDGRYNWELTVIPRPLDLNEANFRSEERSADGSAERAAEHPARLVQSGTFTLSGGAIASPYLVEAAGAGSAEGVGGPDIDDSDGAARE